MNNNPVNGDMDMRRPSFQEITMPKGGGAMRGLGDTYKADLLKGTGAYSIPLPVTPARGFEPQWSLDYNSGAGNSAFGLGFSLAIPGISINTEKRIPRYDGHDVFISADQGELVLRESTAQAPNPRKVTTETGQYDVFTYLPRIESAYSRIERWKKENNAETYWKVTSRENVVSYFGRNAASRIFNPDDPLQVFEWLLDESIDPRENRVLYNYREENEANVPKEVYEVNRSCTAQRYLHSIQYGNYVNPDGNGERFAFTVVFDYGEYDISNPITAWTPVREWACRPDPFSSYRSGFEIRTFRLCQTVLLFHHFERELGAPFLVKATTLEYSHAEAYEPIRFYGMSKMKKAGLLAFRKTSESAFRKQQLPPLEFAWSEMIAPERPEFRTLTTTDGFPIPGYLEPGQFFPIDLNGEGIPGLLYTDGQSVLYLEPEGDGKYKRPAVLPDFPINRNIGEGKVSIQDVDGNGHLELVVADENKAGFYEWVDGKAWQHFRPFLRYPTDYAHPQMENADLGGNGKSDLLLISRNEISIYNSEGTTGYERLRTVLNENGIPIAGSRNPAELVSFANIFGDGMAHRVRVTGNSVECWPSLGYGNFGEQVTMGNPPDFGEQFDAARLYFADIDGSGTADLIYVHPDRVEVYLNQSGNSFSAPVTIYLPAPFSALDQINFADILGNGTSCLVFTKITPTPVQYWYNFAGETPTESGNVTACIKPYLLCQIDNHLGSLTTIRYGSSTRYALEDKQKGRPWPTTLPFPVQVVEEISIHDSISGLHTTQRYSWHDGYYDSQDRAFRGFGYVESWDTESEESGAGKTGSISPVYTRSWFLTGAYAEYNTLLNQYRQEYFNKDTEALDFPRSFFDPDIYSHNDSTIRQAYNALRDKLLRREVYAADLSTLSDIPYTVEESNYTVVLIQAANEEDHGVYRIDSRESIVYNYERNYQDPAATQQFTLEVDPLCGEVKKACTVFLSRRDVPTPSSRIYPEQLQLKATAISNQYINTDQQSDYRYRGLSYDQQEFQLINLSIGSGQYFSYAEISRQATEAFENVVPYMGTPSGIPDAPYATQTNWSTSFFWNEDQSAVLPAGQVSSRALLHHLSQQVYTKENIREIYGDRLSEEVILHHGGYFYNEECGYYENRGLVQHYLKEPNTFFMSWKAENSFVSPESELYRKSTVEYDAYYLAAIESRQYLKEETENVVRAEIDYQVMQPRQIVDINHNVSQALYDAFGKVIVTALFGKEQGNPCGAMRLYEYAGMPAEYVRRETGTDGGPITFDDVIRNPEYYLQGAGSFFYYDLHTYERFRASAEKNLPQPLCSVQLQRFDYYHFGGETTPFRCQTEIEFSDGLGKIIEKKMRVEPGAAFQRDKKGALVKHNGVPAQVQTDERWLVSGRVVYNNKNLVAAEYLAYFSDNPYYESQEDVTNAQLVPPPTLYYYDPLERLVRTVTPKKFFTKTLYGAWDEWQYDEDDTVLDSEYYQYFMAHYPPDPTQQQKDEKNALDKAAHFFNTPTIRVFDNSNSLIREIQTEEGGRELVTFMEEDAQGRKVLQIDPRLFQSNLDTGTLYYNFKYLYPMGMEEYASSDSADAGLERYFNNIFSNLCWSISARNYCQLLQYDRLDRKSKLNVQLIEYDGPVENYNEFNLVEIFTYGESLNDAEQDNLRGQLHQVQDLSGITLSSQYSMLGNVLQSSKQLVADYKTPANWNNTVPLDPKIYHLAFTFDALGYLLTESTPDGSVTTFHYNIAGLLDKVDVAGIHDFQQEIVRQIEYDANRQRKKIVYGNGIQTSYSYEWTTQRLIHQYSTRQNATDPVVQDINYTYDPTGNLTRSWDYSFDTIFYKNQQVDPMSDYTYDALYRLVEATGRQHPGINANTYKNNLSQGSFKQSIFSQLPSLNEEQVLENYLETYTYDDSGNLIAKQHAALSHSYRVDAPVEVNNNHLSSVQYDASGNQRQLSINNTVSLSFNCCENLVRAGIIERPDEPDDFDYYVYDSAEDRAIKVSERMAHGGTVVEITRKVYIGNFEVLQYFKVVNGVSTLTMEKETLRVMDDETCVAILQYLVKDDRKRAVKETGDRSIRFQMSNGNGSLSMEMDAQGLLISYEEYFPFGGTAIITGYNQTEVAQKDYRYSGKECDDSTGLYYFGSRYYISWLGRWLNADPVGDEDGLNLYTYVDNNPLRYSDPNGLMKRTREWELTDSVVKKKVKQPYLKGKSTRGRKSWYTTGVKGVTPTINKSYVTSKTGVIAILKVNGKAIQTGKNGPAFKTLTFPEIGTENQKGLKINPHAEDWNISSFRMSYAASKKTFPVFLSSVGVPKSSLNTGDVAGKPVFSLRINFSPCLGCVGTIISFKEFLESELGAGNFILRTKFLRPYDLPHSLTSDTSSKATNFWDALNLLASNGVYVRLQTKSSAARMLGKPITGSDPFGQQVIKTLFPKDYSQLTKTWKALGISRTK
ncbi:MAG TPA: SpvB/TcaC N-terminal domain-containing protein [Saprospiraceae bacterium]|nr:SpvB/TcaC N-terminal domain-containing protein [Saprospiraceae bacterium]